MPRSYTLHSVNTLTGEVKDHVTGAHDPKFSFAAAQASCETYNKACADATGKLFYVRRTH